MPGNESDRRRDKQQPTDGFRSALCSLQRYYRAKAGTDQYHRVSNMIEYGNEVVDGSADGEVGECVAAGAAITLVVAYPRPATLRGVPGERNRLFTVAVGAKTVYKNTARYVALEPITLQRGVMWRPSKTGFLCRHRSVSALWDMGFMINVGVN